MSRHKPAGKPAAEIHAHFTEWAAQQPTVTSCAICGWEFRGTAEEGRKLSAAHRAELHADIRQTRRRRGSLQRWAVSDDGFQQAGIEQAKEVAEMLKRRAESEAA